MIRCVHLCVRLYRNKCSTISDLSVEHGCECSHDFWTREIAFHLERCSVYRNIRFSSSIIPDGFNRSLFDWSYIHCNLSGCLILNASYGSDKPKYAPDGRLYKHQGRQKNQITKYMSLVVEFKVERGINSLTPHLSPRGVPTHSVWLSPHILTSLYGGISC